jgi:hypothetical protein
MSDLSVEKVSGFIPEVWFDLIGRVVPGTVIVLAAFQTDVFRDLKDLTLGNLAVGLVVVYVVGLVFDVVSDGLFGWIFSALAQRWEKAFYSNKDLWEKAESRPANQRNVIIKIVAEGTLLKSLFFYFFLQLFLRGLECLYGSPLVCSEPLSKLKVHHWKVSLVLGVAAFACWVKMQKVATHRLKVMPNPAVQQP